MKAIAIALAVLAIPVAAQAASHHHRTSHQARAAYAYQPQVACTQYGCLQVPAGCHREAGRTIGGDPTAFDVIACGNSTLYGNR